ncbi:hypothetical protein TPHV1_120083 [Treponema phagedenis]|uniref:Uncharacterized protein n=1 Tax=Treponema phagedenis TaxID=162 RepID=A0A0B7GQU2_TREPH|nr:hypothetical protein TPHV1_120083 [Treponema phagedenis]
MKLLKKPATLQNGGLCEKIIYKFSSGYGIVVCFLRKQGYLYWYGKRE